jgi:hypothetical protein
MARGNAGRGGRGGGNGACGELLAVTVQVAGVAIVVQRSSRPRNRGRLPPHLTTNASRSLRPLETAACINRWLQVYS